MDAMKTSGIEHINQGLHWPLITKEGLNDFGKKVHFYYNYSSNNLNVNHIFPEGIELTNNRAVKQNEMMTLAPWGVLIVEEN